MHADPMLTRPDRLPERRVPAARGRRISVLDRGFIYGDGVYEVDPDLRAHAVPHAAAPAAAAHSLDGIRLANPHTDAQWER
jgi:hypothetical protein